MPKEDSEIFGFSKIIYNKYYVDEFYMFLIVRPVNSLANFFRTTLEPALTKVVFSFGTLANEIGNQGKKLHTGSIGLYLFVFVIGIVTIIIYLFIAQVLLHNGCNFYIHYTFRWCNCNVFRLR